ncbi:MAG: hypothetical protein IJF17_07785 [Thermoguttaceae bacterium]|nr:hypothetical protein [Thermoguttaceae bacterium]
MFRFIMTFAVGFFFLTAVVSKAQTIPAQLPSSNNEKPLSPNALGTAWELFSSDTVRTWEDFGKTNEKNWEPVILPARSNLSIKKIHWYRTSFGVPELKENQKVFLCFDGIRFGSQIWVGTDPDTASPIYSAAGGGEPFEVDISDYVRSGSLQKLIVRVEGVTAVAQTPPETLDCLPGHQPAELFHQRLLFPVGSQGFSGAGIWEPVRLEIRDTIQIDDLFIQTSWREKKIAIDFQVKNLTSRQVSFPVTAEVEGTEIRFDPRNVSISPGESISFRMEKPWKNPRVWCPRDPHLYFLNVKMGDFVNRRERFGFREIWCEGDLFVLNGVPFHVLGTAAHPGMVTVDGDSRQPAKEFFTKLRKAKINSVRLHANYWPKEWCETADELGMPLTLETGFFCRVHAYLMKEEVFWKNFDHHVKALQKKHRNNPSFCFFSLCNEILHCGGKAVDPEVEHHLAEAGKKAKFFDRTRPISFDGDMDPEGSADVVNPHYPMDYAGIRSGNHDWNWPKDCWWIDQGKFMACYPNEFWKWDRKKPLYFGEFLHIQHFNDSNPYSMVIGEKAYAESFGFAMAQAKGKTWRMQIPAYRAAGVTGLCPWTLTEYSPAQTMDGPENARYGAVLDSYEPAAFVLEPIPYAYFSGNEIPMKFWLLNDTDAVRNMTLSVSLGNQTQRVTHRLPPAGRKPVTFIFRANAAPIEKQLVQIFLTHEAVSDPEKPEWNPNHELFGKFLPEGEDPYFQRTGSMKREFPILVSQKFPIRCQTSDSNQSSKLAFIGNPQSAQALGAIHLQDLDALAASKAQTLIIGKNELTQLFPAQGKDNEKYPLVVSRDSQTEILREFLKDPAHRLIIFEQDEYPDGLFPVKLAPAKISPFTNTEWTWSAAVRPFAYPQNKAFQPCEPEKFFGAGNGLHYCPILRSGNLTLCQYPVESSFETDPEMRRELLALLSEKSERDTSPQIFIHDSSQTLQKTFNRLQIPFQNWEQSTSCLNEKKLVFIHSDAEPVAPKRNELFIICGMNPENLKRWEKFFPEKISIQSMEAQAFRDFKVSGDLTGLFQGSSSSLYWLGDRNELTSRQKTPIQKIADWQLIPFSPDPEKRDQFPFHSFREFTPNTEKGQWFSDHFYCGTWVKIQTRLPEPSGWHLLEIEGEGTRLKGIGCVLEVRVNGKLQGSVELETKFSRKSILVYLPKDGDNLLELEFSNDLWDPVTREDRNMKFRGVQVIPCRKVQSFTASIIPFCSGKITENIVLDCVKWFDPDYPTEGADQYLLNILHSAGVSMPWHLGCVQITADNWDKIQHKIYSFGKSGPPVANLGTNGTISKKIQFLYSGKFLFTLHASGTSVHGVYPHLNLRVDGRIVGEFQLDENRMKDYVLEMPIEISAGKHQIELEFDNDLHIPSPENPNASLEDRNIKLESLMIQEIR